MFNNLKAEMVRNNLTQKDLAVCLEVDDKTISFKLNGKSKFDVDEMWRIKDKLFPSLSLDYLFKIFEK